MKYILLLLISISYVSSAQIPQKVLYSLQKAGKNRGELEHAIRHYQQDKDSLKLKACYFLLENMEGHKHLDAENLRPFDTIFGVYDSLLTNKIVVHKQETAYPEIDDAWYKIVEKYEDPNTLEYPDLEHITADFLIDNIDGAFQAWHTYPWAKHLTWEQFCEYLLPYKMSNEPLVPWRSTMMKKYSWLSDSLPDKSDAIHATRVLYNNLKWFLLNKKLWYHPLVGATNLHTAKAGTCHAKTDLNMFVMRAMGLAITRDFVLHWGNREGNHYWNSFVMNDGSFLDFEALGAVRMDWQGRMKKHKQVNKIGILYDWEAKPSKVFREIFSEQSETLVTDNLLGVNEKIPFEFQNTRIKDVTHEYTKVATAKVQLSSRATYPKYAYLCTYNEKEWRPAFWGKVTSNGEALFKNMGTDLVYLPCRYENWKFVPEGDPFILDSLGVQHFLNGNTNQVETSVTFPRANFPMRIKNGEQLPIVHKGEVHKLLYWSKDKWVLHNEKPAEENAHITFENVPQNRLLRLERVDIPKNERIFYYANGVQYFY